MKKLSGYKKAFVAVAAAVAILAGTLCITGCEENVNLTYENAERAFLSSSTDNDSMFERLLQNRDGIGKDGKMTLTVTPEQHVADILGEKKLNPTVFEIALSSARDRDAFAQITYKNGTKEILSAEMWLGEEQIIAHIPALLEKYILADVGLPSEAVAKSLFDAVLDEYFKLVSGAHTEKGVELTINASKIRADRTTIEITRKMLGQLALAALHEVKESVELKVIERLERMIDSESADEVCATMTVYVKGSKIVKRVIDGGEKYRFSLAVNPKSGDFELETAGSFGKYKVGVNGKASGNGFVGEITLNNIKMATMELTKSKQVIDAKPLPTITLDNSIGGNDLKNQMLQLLLSVKELNCTLDDDGVYDVVGAYVKS